jgi:hypothetical protein
MESRNGEVFADRLEALHEGGGDSLRGLLERHPVIAAAVAGEGPLAGKRRVAYLLRQANPVGNVTEMARLLAQDLFIEITVNCATRNEQQLLALAVWHGGAISREDTIAVTGAPPDSLDRAVRGLAELFLADPAKGWLVLRPGVGEQVWLPGYSIRQLSDNIHSPQLEAMLRNLGVDPPPRKWERVDAIEAALRDRTVVERAIAGLQPEEISLLQRLIKAGRAVKLDEWDLPSQHIYGPSPVLDRLNSKGLIGYSRWERVAWVWLDVVVALSDGKMFRDWEEPKTVPRPINGSAPARVPAVVGRLDALLDRWSTSPPPALKSGGLGVKPIRAAAKTLAMSSTEVGLIAALAIELGLLAPVVTSRKGRGRNQTVDEEWRPTDSHEAWRQDDAGRRWARMVQQWIDSDHLEVTGKAIERFEYSSPQLVAPLARAALIKTLADLPEGEGLAVDDLTARLVFDNVGLMAPAIVNQLVNEARVLGLVPGDGPVGLTPSGRMLLAGIQALETMTGGGPRQFTVQPDHTIIAPPDLDAEVIADLERFTSLESEAGALIYRITTEDTVRALDSGWTADEILEFLAEGSSVPVAQNVARTITDAADRHGRITVGSSATWVTCDDSVLLANAVAVKSAKLVAVSPTLAVSELPREKVLVALRARGLAPREQSSGEPESAPTPSYLPAIELRDRLLPNSDDIAALAARVIQGEEPAPVDDNWETELLEFIQTSGGDV